MSNDPSSKGSDATSACFHVTLELFGFDRATSSMAAFASTPVTFAPASASQSV
jgi:hypothetical protein